LSRINDKIEEIKKYLGELSSIVPEKIDEYKSDNLTKAACERYVEKIIEASTDLAFLIIKNKKLEIPEDDIHAFRILKDNKIIKEELYNKLKEAKGMKNIIAHQYGDIDDKIVFDSIKNKLEKDVNSFIKEVKRCL